MINAASVTSPMEIGMERGTSGVQKSQSDGPEFGSILESKMNDQREQTHEAKPAEANKPQESSESKAADSGEVKSESKPEAKTEDKPEAKTEAKSDAESDKQVEAKDGDDQASQQTVQQVPQDASQQVSQTIGEVVVAAVAAEASAKAQGQSAVQVSDQTASKAVQNVAEMQVTASAQNASTAQNVSMETTLASEVGKQAESDDVKVELPITSGELEKLVDQNAEKSAQAGEDVLSKFFGPTARQQAQAMVDAQVKTTAANASASSLYTGAAVEGTKTSDEKAENPLLGSAKNPIAQAVASEALLTAAVKPAEGTAKDVTFSPQVIAAIMQNAEQKAEVVQAVDTSENTGSESAQTSDSQSGTQEASAVMPGRTSFESVIRGLDNSAPAASTPSTSPSTTETYTKIVDQLVREIKLRQYQGGSDLMVKLNPAELGQIRLQISQTADGLTSQIHASSEQVKGLLQAHLPALTEALSNAGLKMDQVTVTSGASFGSLMQDNTSGMMYQQQQRQRHQQPGGHQQMMVNPALINAVNNAALAGSVGYSWLA